MVWRSYEESDENMSEVKSPKKGDAGSTKSEAKKTEAKKPEGEKSATAAETASTDKSASKADAAPKSASQSSISHFSSVSTPAYRSGWNNVFGGGGTTKKKNSKTSDGDDFPDHFTISDEDIDSDLRDILYKLFQKKARKQGFSLAKIKKQASIEYRLDCNIEDK